MNWDKKQKWDKNKPIWRQLMQDPGMPPAMRAQLEQMRLAGLKWKAEHPQAVLLFEFPGERTNRLVFVGAIDEVIEGGAMKANPEAVEFFKALWPWHCHDTPTLNMCRLVVEQVYGESKATT